MFNLSSEGSETDHVTYVLTGNEYETCQVVYTAVTRGRKSVTLIGTRDELNAAIGRAPKARNTTLKERLVAALSSPEPPAESPPPSIEFGDLMNDDDDDPELEAACVFAESQAIINSTLANGVEPTQSCVPTQPFEHSLAVGSLPEDRRIDGGDETVVAVNPDVDGVTEANERLAPSHIDYRCDDEKKS